jgi:peptidoglycan/LPS O-acetylase OafA/YrhL
MIVQQPSSNQWEVLAAARFVLAMGVLLGHLYFALGPSVRWTAIGYYLGQSSAVYGFLLISGYSIAASLERAEKGFLWRRARRIYPVYIASIFLVFAANTIRVAPQPALIYFMALVMLQTILVPTVAGGGQLWSLAVEWWNYILAPLFRILPGIGVWLLVAISFCLFILLTPAEPAFTLHGIMFAQLSWLWLIGFLYYRYRRSYYGYVLLFFPLILALALNHNRIGSAVWVGAAALAFCEDIPIAQTWRAACRWLGDLSYPIYAVHVPIVILYVYWGVKAPSLIALTVIVVSIVVLHAIDLPARRLRFVNSLNWMAERSVPTRP